MNIEKEKEKISKRNHEMRLDGFEFIGGAAGRQKWRKERERRIEMERLEEEKNKS
jgi:hypothetical protein